MKAKFELCDNHEDTWIWYDAGFRCPLCNAQEEIEVLKEKIEELNNQEAE